MDVKGHPVAFILHMIVVHAEREGGSLSRSLSDLGKFLFVCLKIPQNFAAFDHLLIFLWKCSKHVRPGVWLGLEPRDSRYPEAGS